MTEYLQRLAQTVAGLEMDDVTHLLQDALEKKEDPYQLLEAMSKGLTRVGELFEKGDYFLADLVLAGEMMKEGFAILEPFLQKETKKNRGTVVLCTVKGDVHDIGKNLVGIMLTSAGFRVVDLGVDVPASRVVEAVIESSAGGVALSVLLTTMVGSIGDVVNALQKEGLRDKVTIAIGGACTTSELADRMGVDACGRSAVEAVHIFESYLNPQV